MTSPAVRLRPKQPFDLIRYSAYWPNIPAKIPLLKILAEEFYDGDLSKAVGVVSEHMSVLCWNLSEYQVHFECSE
jgi:hypothetical protein